MNRVCSSGPAVNASLFAAVDQPHKKALPDMEHPKDPNYQTSRSEASILCFSVGFGNCHSRQKSKRAVKCFNTHVNIFADKPSCGGGDR